jgi:hypothetical protein
MKWFLIGWQLLMSSVVLAQWNLTPRLESIHSERTSYQNLLIKNTLNFDGEFTRLFVEAFAEQNFNSAHAEEMRTPPRGYLQEAYLEFHWGDHFFKLGRQAVRWSEMWATPSLDVFTGHRFNRAFIDPLSEQLTHSTGLLWSYAGRNASLDVYSLWQGAETTYPEPFPEKEPTVRSSVEGGIRGKFDGGGHQFTGVVAQLEQSYVYGVGWSYAFESFVPKLEAGQRLWQNADERPFQPLEVDFLSAGTDVFIDRWMLTPQVTLAYDDWNERVTNLYYGNLSWIGDRHEWSLQGSLYDPLLGQFLHVGYTYKPSGLWMIQSFWQNYDGSFDSIYGAYHDRVGSSVFGLRWQMDIDVLSK